MCRRDVCGDSDYDSNNSFNANNIELYNNFYNSKAMSLVNRFLNDYFWSYEGLFMLLIIEY